MAIYNPQIHACIYQVCIECVCVCVKCMHMHLHCICVLPICVFISLEVTMIAITQTQQALLQNVKVFHPALAKNTARCKSRAGPPRKTCPAMDSEKKQTCLGQGATDMHASLWVFTYVAPFPVHTCVTHVKRPDMMTSSS